MNNPKISLYTVLKRYPTNWLRYCIRGVMNQTYTNTEYVFVIYGADNDLDGILRELEPLDGNYKLYYIPEVEGFVDAIRFAVSKCDGDYVLRADSEDELLPYAIETMVKECKDDVIIIPNHVSVDNEGNILDNNVDGKLMNISSNCIMRRDYFNKVKLHKLQSCRDGYTILLALEHDGRSATYLPVPLFKYRKNPGSITNNTRTTDIKKFNEQLVDNMYHYGLDDEEILIDHNDKFLITSKRMIERTNSLDN